MNTIDPEIEWRRSLRVGDQVGIACPDMPEIGHFTEIIVKASRKRVDTAYGNFWRESGRETYRPSSHVIVPPTAEGIDMREKWIQAQELSRKIRNVDMSKQPLRRLQAIAWLLDIDHGCAPGFDAENFDREARAILLEALIKSIVGFDQVSVNGLSGSCRALRQAAASVVENNGPKKLYSVGLTSLVDIPIGNGEGAEELAHLVAYALKSMPDYIRMLRDEPRMNERIGRLTSVNARLRFRLNGWPSTAVNEGEE